MLNIYILIAMAALASAQTCTQWPAGPNNARVQPGFCLNRWATGLSSPRGIFVDETGLVLIRESNRISAFWDDNNDGQSGNGERAVILNYNGLNHDVSYYEGYLYASTGSTVLRWPYTPGQRTPITAAAQNVVTGIPSGGHSARPVALKDGMIYVTVGSAGNVDNNSDRSRIIRFPLATLPHAFDADDDDQIFADGLRNECGINFDRNGMLWGVQNGRDNLVRSDMGGSLVTDNPCEEINAFNETEAGRFYGYPYCWSDTGLDARTGGEAREQWADTEYFGPPYTDDWCKNYNNNIPPRWCLGAHQAPLGFSFFYAEDHQGAPYALPSEMDGDMFVALHGSWNRSPAAGYQLRHIIFQNNVPVDDEYIFEYNGANPPNGGGGWVRPVDVEILDDGTMLVTADSTGEVLSVRWIGGDIIA